MAKNKVTIFFQGRDPFGDSFSRSLSTGQRWAAAGSGALNFGMYMAGSAALGSSAGMAMNRGSYALSTARSAAPYASPAFRSMSAPAASRALTTTRITDPARMLPVQKTVLGPEGPGQFVMRGGGPLHSTVAVRKGSLVNRVFDSGFASNPKAAQPLGRYFGEGGILPSSAADATVERGLHLPDIINDAHMGAVYRAQTHIPALRGPALGGTKPELIIEPKYFKEDLYLQGGYSTLP